MKSKLLIGLSIALSATVVLVLVCLVLASWWRPPQSDVSDRRTSPAAVPGNVIERSSLPNPPPAPKPVANPLRVRQNLQAGKTYVTHTKGTLHVRATDKDWGLEEVITINYVFEAKIDREIESNDGRTIVELRRFRDVRSLKLETKLEDVRIDLGSSNDSLLGNLALFAPKVAVVVKALDGTSVKPVLTALRPKGVDPETLLKENATKAFATVDRLSGKSVRLTYVDGKGVSSIESVDGDITGAERDFHFSSAILSDSLIFPNTDVTVGDTWPVEGSSFANFIDPSLLARISGEAKMKLVADRHIVQDKPCRHIKFDEGGRFKLDESDPKVGRIGHFDPQGSMYFSVDDKIIIQADLTGKAQLDKFSKDHLLFQARMRQTPELQIRYTCRIEDTRRRQP